MGPEDNLNKGAKPPGCPHILPPVAPKGGPDGSLNPSEYRAKARYISWRNKGGVNNLRRMAM